MWLEDDEPLPDRNNTHLFWEVVRDLKTWDIHAKHFVANTPKYWLRLHNSIFGMNVPCLKVSYHFPTQILCIYAWP